MQIEDGVVAASLLFESGEVVAGLVIAKFREDFVLESITPDHKRIIEVLLQI